MEKAATREKQEEQEQQNKNISIGRNNEKGDEKRTINHVSFNWYIILVSYILYVISFIYPFPFVLQNVANFY